MKLSTLIIPFASAFLSLDPEITTLEPQLETAQVWTTMPPVQEAEAIAFLPTLMSTTTEETTAVTSTTLYNNDGIVGLKFAGGKSDKKSKKPKKSGKKKPAKKPVVAAENIMKIRGDEAAPRKDHKCGEIPLPEIKCADCAQGFPRYRRPCGGPEETKGVFKCRIECGPGFKVSDGSPKKMKCLGKPNEAKFWKVRPATQGHVIQCERK